MEMVIRFLSTYESVEIKTDGEPSIVEVARRVQARRDKVTTLAQTSVGGSSRNWSCGTCEWNSAGTVASRFSGCANSNESENHSRYTVVSVDVAVFCLDGGALPIRSKNETDSV